MKRISTCIAAACVAALIACALVGCSGQAASSASASASSASAAPSASASSASASSEVQTTEVQPAEMKEVLANIPAVKSVTVTDEEDATFTFESGDSSASAASSGASASASSAAATETIATTTVYKFDATGDKLKTSMETELEGVKLQYFTEGDDAVFVTDGPIYAGTVEQFDLSHGKGFDAYIKDTVGDPNVLLDCASSIEKMEVQDLSIYILNLDPAKYIASDEVLGAIAQAGDPVTEARFSIGINGDGSIASVDLIVSYETNHTRGSHLLFADYGSTTVDPMPAADRTYEDMEADMKLKLDAMAKQLESEETGAASEASADAK